MKHTVDTKTLQEVLNYLASRPFAEVSKLISDLQANAKPLTDVGATAPLAEESKTA